MVQHHLQHGELVKIGVQQGCISGGILAMAGSGGVNDENGRALVQVRRVLGQSLTRRLTMVWLGRVRSQATASRVAGDSVSRNCCSSALLRYGVSMKTWVSLRWRERCSSSLTILALSAASTGR